MVVVNQLYLNMIAGLDAQTEGNILLKNREIKGPGPERAVVFQNHSLTSLAYSI